MSQIYLYKNNYYKQKKDLSWLIGATPQPGSAITWFTYTDMEIIEKVLSFGEEYVK